MRKMTVLGASALLIAGLMASPTAAFAAPTAGAPVAVTGGESTCLPKEDKVDVGGEQTSITVPAPDGMLIVGYCVKAGSDKQGDGPEYFEVDPTDEVTIEHSSGKAISHYTLITVEAGPTPSPTPTPSMPGEEPSASPEPSVVPTDESSEPAVVPTDGTTEPGDEAGAEVGEAEAAGPEAAEGEGEPPVLAATGASTAIGFALIALALVGGGATLIVLRRKGVLGS